MCMTTIGEAKQKRNMCTYGRSFLQHTVPLLFSDPVIADVPARGAEASDGQFAWRAEAYK